MTVEPGLETTLGSAVSSALDEAYLKLLADRRVPAAELTETARGSALLSVAYRGRFLPRPVFLDRAERARLTADLLSIHELLTSLPGRLFGGDRRELARAVGMNDVQADLVGLAPATPPRVLARSDLYRTVDGFKLLELNITSALGGFENAEINRAMLRHPLLAQFVNDHGLTYIDTMAAIVDTMRTECAAWLERPHPVIALVDWPDSYQTYEPRLRVWAAMFQANGFEAVPCHAGQLRRSQGRLWLGDTAIDVVYRFFLVEEVVTADDFELLAPILQAADEGAVTIFSRLDAELYGNKGALALLSDDRHRAAFSPAELRCIDTFLPWTRTVRSEITTEQGEEVDLIEHALAHQGDLILKPTLLHGGSGIVAGWEVGADEWRIQLEQAVDHPYVLQARVRPKAEIFSDFGNASGAEPAALYLNWGVFVVDPDLIGGDGHGGCIVRGAPDSEVGVVSMGTGARVGCCFSLPPDLVPR